MLANRALLTQNHCGSDTDGAVRKMDTKGRIDGGSLALAAAYYVGRMKQMAALGTNDSQQFI
jgi:hypothetical protein